MQQRFLVPVVRVGRYSFISGAHLRLLAINTAASSTCCYACHPLPLLQCPTEEQEDLSLVCLSEAYVVCKQRQTTLPPIPYGLRVLLTG